MPKLYFHDTGLACWLLGIREPAAASRASAARGALRNGAELDLVIEEADALTLVDAKSSAIPSSSLLVGTRRVVRSIPSLQVVAERPR